MLFCNLDFSSTTSSEEKIFASVYKKIKAICIDLSLPPTFIEQSASMFKHLKNTRNYRQSEGIIGVVIYLVCKQMNFPRSIKELQAVMPNLHSKDFKKHYKEIVVEIEKSDKKETLQCSSYMRRFCSKLAFKHRDTRACEEIADILSNDSEFESVKPALLAASIIYTLSLEESCASHPKVSVIAQVTMVAQASISYYYKKIKLRNCVPDWYLNSKK
jgi:transcription initiation factor TFIIIB Brf1 subunit/transcription initiation factor TFIIB